MSYRELDDSLRVSGNPYGDRIFGKQGFDEFRPLYETVTSRIEIIFIADIKNLLRFFDPVKIEMINWFTVAGFVFVDN